MSLAVKDIVVLTEVWDEVVHVVVLWRSWCPGQKGLSVCVDLSIKLNMEIVILGKVPRSVLVLLLAHVMEGINDIVVDTEVWNWVV